MTEPFLLLSEFERHVRKLLDGKVSEDELRKARDPSDSGRDVQRVHDLTLGECTRLVEVPHVPSRLGLPLIHRQTVTESLRRITRIRNDVMHFNPDHQMLVHLLKVHGWPNSPSAGHWRGEFVAFQKDASRRFAPSIRQRIDLARHYRDPLEQLETVDYEGGPPRASPTNCPLTLDQLFSEKRAAPEQRLAATSPGGST